MALRKLMLLTVMTGVVGAQRRPGMRRAQFMRRRRRQLTGTGNLALGADETSPKSARAMATTAARGCGGRGAFSYAGLPPGKSKLDYLMTVKNGQATFLKYASAGEAPSLRGSVRPAHAGPVRLRWQAQRRPEAAGFVVPPEDRQDAPVGGQPSTTVRIGQKTVGQRSRWTRRWASSPATRSPNSDPTMASFQGLTIPIPA